jgi:hypothetical protein
MSDFRAFWLGKGEFKTPQEIVRLVRTSRDYDHAERESEEPLLIFQTSKQQTWLVATAEKLYCVLDDVNRGFTRVQWWVPRSNLVSDGKLIARIETGNKTDRTGLLDIGKHRGWLYSKKLFTTEPVEVQVHRLILSKMV